MYLASLARFPTVHEQAAMLELFRDSDGDRRAATEDALWVLLNTRQFVFNY